MDSLSRREFLTAALAAPVLAEQLHPPPQTPCELPNELPPGLSTILTTDRARLLARADLVYDSPAPRSEEGIPIGNGRMGSLVWTTPNAIRLQINRVDVYGND